MEAESDVVGFAGSAEADLAGSEEVVSDSYQRSHLANIFRCRFRFALDSLEEANSEGQVVASPAAGDPV